MHAPNHHSLCESTEHAHSCYTNVTALFQWADAKRDELGLPETSFTYKRAKKLFQGSCLEQIRSVASTGIPLRYIRSVANKRHGQSFHHAAVSTVGNVDYLVDPQFCPKPIPLDELLKKNRMVIESIPRVDGKSFSLELVVQNEDSSPVIGMTQCNVRGDILTSEQFSLDANTFVEELPSYPFDMASAVLQKRVIMRILLTGNEASDENDCVGVELSLRERKSKRELIMNLLSTGERVTQPGDIESFMDAIAHTRGTTRDTIETFLAEGYMLYKKAGPLVLQRLQEINFSL